MLNSGFSGEEMVLRAVLKKLRTELKKLRSIFWKVVPMNDSVKDSKRS